MSSEWWKRSAQWSKTAVNLTLVRSCQVQRLKLIGDLDFDPNGLGFMDDRNWMQLGLS